MYICGVYPLQCIRKVNGGPHLLFLSVPKGREGASHTPYTLRTLQLGHFHPFVGDARKYTCGCSHKNGGCLLEKGNGHECHEENKYFWTYPSPKNVPQREQNRKIIVN